MYYLRAMFLGFPTQSKQNYHCKKCEIGMILFGREGRKEKEQGENRSIIMEMKCTDKEETKRTKSKRKELEERN